MGKRKKMVKESEFSGAKCWLSGVFECYPDLKYQGSASSSCTWRRLNAAVVLGHGCADGT